MSIMGDDVSSSYTTMKSMVTLRSKSSSRKSDAKPGSSGNAEHYAETKFGGEEDSEDLSRSSINTNYDRGSSSSVHSDVDDADETPSARRADFSIYQIDEEEGGRREDKESGSQLMSRIQGHEEGSDAEIGGSNREKDGKEDMQEEMEETKGNESMKESDEESTGEGLESDRESGEEGEMAEDDNRTDGNKANEGRETQMSQIKGGESDENHLREESTVEESNKQKEHPRVGGAEEGIFGGENE